MAIDFDDAQEGSEESEVMAGMNTTPLIDVLLVLLVMLIITIPIQLNAVSMDLPVGPPPGEVAEPVVVRLDISPASQIAWNGEAVPGMAELRARLHAAAQGAEPPEIHVRADPKTPYDTVAAVLTAAQTQGLQKIGVVNLEEISR